MSFDPFQGRPRLRRTLPWAAWGVALVVVIWQHEALSLGTVSPAVADARLASLNAPRAARVKSVHKQAGDAVDVGEVVVVLEAPDLLAELAVARADLTALESEVLAKSADVREADRDVLAGLGQDVERAAVDAARFRADLDSDRGELAGIVELLKRLEALLQKGLATSSDQQALLLKKAGLEERVRTSQALVDAARTHEEQSRARLHAFLAERKRPTPAAPSGPKPTTPSPMLPEERVAPAQASALAQAARVRALEDAVADLSIKSPVQGTVVDVFAVAGASVGTELPVVTVVAAVVDGAPTTLTAWADERIARRIHVGDDVVLQPSDRVSGERRGVIKALSPTIAEMPLRFRPIPQQPAFARAVVVELTDGLAAPLPGMAFDARFESPLLKKALVEKAR